MAYDNSISNEVSLAKILDQMILEETDVETIKAFLRQHESKVKDIFSQSALIYDFYDIVSNPNSFDPYFIEHIEYLPQTDLFYAFASYCKWVECNYLDKTLLKNIKMKKSVRDRLAKFARFRGNFRGQITDNDIAEFKLDLVDHIESISGDARDISSFIGNSYFLKSAMMPRTFLRLSLATQYALVTGLVKKFEQSTRTAFTYGGFRASAADDPAQKVCCDLIISLLKQFLAMNDMDSFNWFLHVVGTDKTESTIRNGLGLNLISRVPNTIVDSINSGATFEDVVFDMNMLESEFDSTDLFLYAYVSSTRMLKAMKDNKDLIEFFNPMFDWQKLEYLK